MGPTKPRRRGAGPRWRDDSGDAANTDLAVVVFKERLAGALAGRMDQPTIRLQALQNTHQPVHITRVDLPATVKSPNDAGGRGVHLSYIYNGPAGCEDAIHLARDHGAMHEGVLCNHSNVALGKGLRQFGARA